MTVVEEAVGLAPSRRQTSAGPLRIAASRLRADRLALVGGVAFLVIVLACLLAPAYASYVADTGPNANHLSETIRVGDTTKNVVSLDGVPVGPTWSRHFLLGADLNGRDTAVRALYGGRNSMEIGLVATLITLFGAILLGVSAGYFRGAVDIVISRLMDAIWAFPAVLLGVALGVSLAIDGLSIGFVHIAGGSNLIPAFVIGFVYIPYVGRALRGEVLALRDSEFVDAARVLGHGPLRIMFREILPNLAPMLVAFFALQFAASVVTEASLSFLGAGVQPPDASWGTMLAEGNDLLASGSALHMAVVPAVFLVGTVLSANLFADGVRKAFDPKSKVRAR